MSKQISGLNAAISLVSTDVFAIDKSALLSKKVTAEQVLNYVGENGLIQSPNPTSLIGGVTGATGITGTDISVYGMNAGNSLTNQSNVDVFGSNALYSNTANSALGLGSHAAYNATNCHRSVIAGSYAAFPAITVSDSTITGVEAMRVCGATITQSTIYGFRAAYRLEVGNACVFGPNAVNAATTATQLAAFGTAVAYPLVNGNAVSVFGYEAMRQCGPMPTEATSFGFQALYRVQGMQNAAFGSNAGHETTTAIRGTYVGAGSGYSNTIYNDVTTCGFGVGRYGVLGAGTTGMGSYAFRYFTGGQGTTCGAYAGNLMTTGTPCDFFGYLAGGDAVAQNNISCIGNNTVIGSHGSNSMVLGNLTQTVYVDGVAFVATNKMITPVIEELVPGNGINFSLSGQTGNFYDYTGTWFSMSGSGTPDDGTNFYIPYNSSDGWYFGYGMAADDKLYFGSTNSDITMTGNGRLKSEKLNVGTSSPLTTTGNLVDIGGSLSFSASFYPTIAATASQDAATGIMYRNSSGGESASSALAIVDSNDSFTALELWGTNKTGTLFGVNMNDQATLYTGLFGSKQLVVGTIGANDLVLGTAGVARMTISGTAGMVTLPSGTGINEFSTDGTLGGASDNAVPTEKAVKTYVDSISPTHGDVKHENILWAGDFRLNPGQEQQTITSATTPIANNDGVYCADGVIYQADGANVLHLSRSTAADNISALRGNVQTANKKFGFVIPLENLTTQRLLEILPFHLSMRLRARKLNGSFDFKIALIEWNGAVDSVTRAVVSTWNANGTDPTLAANWSYITGTTQSSVALDLTYDNYDYDDVQIPIGTGANNIAVFVFTDNAPTSTARIFDIQWLTMNEGTEAIYTDLENVGSYLDKCYRYYEHSYIPGTPAGVSNNSNAVQNVQPIAGTNVYTSLRYRTDKIKNPTVNILATDQANYTANLANLTVPGTGIIAVLGVTDNSASGFSRILLGASLSADAQFEYHWIADARP